MRSSGVRELAFEFAWSVGALCLGASGHNLIPVTIAGSDTWLPNLDFTRATDGFLPWVFSVKQQSITS